VVFFAKTFFIWFLTSNKIVLEIKPAVKESFSLNTMSLYKSFEMVFEMFSARIYFETLHTNTFSTFQIICSMVFIGHFLKGSVEKPF